MSTAHWHLQVGIGTRTNRFILGSQASPRLGHLEVLYNVFAYLKKHLDMERLAYDSKAPNVDRLDFVQGDDWKDFYGDVEEELPPRIPEPRGSPVIIIAFFDAYHSRNVVTRRSHTGIIIFFQNAQRDRIRLRRRRLGASFLH